MSKTAADAPTFVIEVKDASGVIGYAFVAQTEFVPVDAAGKADRLASGIEALFADGSGATRLTAVALPGDSADSRAVHADFGSGKRK